MFAIRATNAALGISTDRTELAGLLWEGNERAMSQGLSRIRSDIRKAIDAREEEPLPMSRSAVLFPREYYSSDLQFFFELVGKADAALTREDADTALRSLRTALDLVRGEPLRDLPGEWAEARRAQLQGEIARVAARATELALNLGRAAQIAEFMDAQSGPVRLQSGPMNCGSRRPAEVRTHRSEIGSDARGWSGEQIRDFRRRFVARGRASPALRDGTGPTGPTRQSQGGTSYRTAGIRRR